MRRTLKVIFQSDTLEWLIGVAIALSLLIVSFTWELLGGGEHRDVGMILAIMTALYLLGILQLVRLVVYLFGGRKQGEYGEA